MKSLGLSLGMLVVGTLCVAGDIKAAKPTASKPTNSNPATKPLPSFDTVTKKVQQFLALDAEYRSGDLLTASKVERVLAKLEQTWKVADAKEIARLAVPDSDWLATRLATADGKEFMRHIGGLTGGYDRLDRLRHMPYGENQISDFIRSPGGFKMIEYMTTTQGGRNLGEQLSEGVNGQDFNQRTGRIYTERDLLTRLKHSYEAEVARRKRFEPKHSTRSGKWKRPPAKQEPAEATPSGEGLGEQ